MDTRQNKILPSNDNINSTIIQRKNIKNKNRETSDSSNTQEIEEIDSKIKPDEHKTKKEIPFFIIDLLTGLNSSLYLFFKEEYFFSINTLIVLMKGLFFSFHFGFILCFFYDSSKNFCVFILSFFVMVLILVLDYLKLINLNRKQRLFFSLSEIIFISLIDVAFLTYYLQNIKCFLFSTDQSKPNPLVFILKDSIFVISSILIFICSLKVRNHKNLMVCVSTLVSLIYVSFTLAMQSTFLNALMIFHHVLLSISFEFLFLNMIFNDCVSFIEYFKRKFFVLIHTIIFCLVVALQVFFYFKSNNILIIQVSQNNFN